VEENVLAGAFRSNKTEALFVEPFDCTFHKDERLKNKSRKALYCRTLYLNPTNSTYW
jgi:hypothetical protein